jgi:hypothetical protein
MNTAPIFEKDKQAISHRNTERVFSITPWQVAKENT